MSLCFTRWLPVALLVASIFACSPPQESPETITSAFIRAIQTNNGNEILAYLEEPAIHHLQSAAQRASNQLGGRRSIAPHEMVHILIRDPMFELAAVEPIDNDGQIAHVRVSDTQKRHYTFTLVFADGHWKVRVPLPPSS